MKYDKTNTLNDDSSVVQSIMRKIKIYAARYYKYAFPEEQFFREIAEKCIGDAFGADHTESFTKTKINELWNYVKRQALNYILNIEAELQKEFPNQGQISFYAFKLNCKVEDLQAKVDSFKSQLMDRDDFVPR
jgi:hypothetical protein